MESSKKMSLVAVMVLVAVATAALRGVSGDGDVSRTPPTVVKKVKGTKLCAKGWECNQLSQYCCNLTITDFFEAYQFENLFSKRNSPVAHAVGFWDYRSFILASASFQPLGFGTTGGKLMQMKELAAFLGHVGSKTSCLFSVLTHHFLLLSFNYMLI